MQKMEAPTIHYDRIGLRDRLVAVLAAAGYANGQIELKDLAALDQFHSRGLEATVDLANELALDANTSVIDIGSGLGGPSRYLAHRFGCKVLGIDISPSFVEAATYLASRTNLSDRVSFQLGNALSLPFPDRFFDVAWTQHVAMNIRDRELLYAEAFRVLKPGGQFAIYDVVAGSAGPLIFPVPWSASEEGSFLLSSDAMQAVLDRAGFTIQSWKDRSEASVAWFKKRAVAVQRSPLDHKSALGLDIVMGPEFPVMSANLLQNLEDGRAGLIETVLRRP
ncbi:class I SAM-dependent methyltransferase [Bradyrhizobium australafricanum]|uniref:class I SAM-dependent methyltransferase n=1 Tax=Bradyrhizobium australafricanum TaxID=2821406 RepID=UPI001CE29FFA|nr:methyltransferase domain-containing protein [Bradyrhizobium australafricanum]MCA6100551.1 class I SAM-dependent methyltransferase [Bradyrhizobium australafricanum]